MKAIKRTIFALLVMAVAVGVFFCFRPVECFNQLTYLQESMQGVESHTAAIAGYRIHYNIVGPKNGAPVVLVHGLGGRAEDWRSLYPYLVKAGYRVYMPDLPGYGRSEQPASFSYSVHDEAEQVIYFMDAMGLKQVDLGGWSMGGGIVQHTAFRHPDRIRRLMLFDAVGILEMPKWNVGLFTPHSALELDQLRALLEPKPQSIPAFVAHDVLRASAENAWVIHRALEQMLNGRDATNAMLPQFKMPVLIVWGDADKIFPVSQAETMHRLVPNSELTVAKGCGHLAPGECADQIGPKMVNFLKR
jgi:pimeloyl-ACP methyl ester carboxylesterase